MYSRYVNHDEYDDDEEYNEDLSARITASSHLTYDKIHYLENYDYVVGPKANGERMLLWGGKKSKHLHLISPVQLHNVKIGYFVSLLKTFEYLNHLVTRWTIINFLIFFLFVFVM